MLGWALVFAVLAIVAGALGFFALAGMGAAGAQTPLFFFWALGGGVSPPPKILFVLFIVLLIVSFIMRALRRGPIA
jgi:uncharacterized membrane protein YtjA (UPF0391 family)